MATIQEYQQHIIRTSGNPPIYLESILDNINSPITPNGSGYYEVQKSNGEFKIVFEGVTSEPQVSITPLPTGMTEGNIQWDIDKTIIQVSTTDIGQYIFVVSVTWNDSGIIRFGSFKMKLDLQ